VLVLAPQLGALGAAYAYIAAILVIDILEYSEARFLIRLSPFGTSLIKPIVVIGGLTLALLLLAQMFALSLWSVIALALVFVVCYVVLMLRVALPAADAVAVWGLVQQFRGALRRQAN
jgi:hypothetical protein